MKIKKIGHCCLVVHIGNKRVMTDPGSYSIEGGQEHEKNIDLIVITHEHQDHLHLESLKKILLVNPTAVVVTNSSVGRILGEAGISHELLEDGCTGEFAGVYLEAYGDKHEEVYESFGQVQNTGYFIGEHLFYPGDAFTNPSKKVDTLALPVAGPWMRIKQAMEYVKEINPRVCFPVHDGMIQIDKPGPLYVLPKKILPELGIEFKVLEIGKEEEI